MLQKFRNRVQDEQGFTLIELLVVILIIGILAAIALPTFLGQQNKAKDAAAKSNARNLVSSVESCFATEQAYTNCNTLATLNDGQPLGFPLSAAAPAAGEAGVVVHNANDYRVEAQAKDTTNVFTITKTAAGVTTRTCTTASTGGCATGGVW